MFLHGSIVVYNGYYGRGYVFGVNYQPAVEAPQQPAQIGYPPLYQIILSEGCMLLCQKP